MYRLLFLFYIEARPELGYAPVDAEAYRKGYSLEHLRDLELVRLTGDESLNGYYIHESVQNPVSPDPGRLRRRRPEHPRRVSPQHLPDSRPRQRLVPRGRNATVGQREATQ